MILQEESMLNHELSKTTTAKKNIVKVLHFGKIFSRKDFSALAQKTRFKTTFQLMLSSGETIKTI
jgi:hypothetical protein